MINKYNIFDESLKDSVEKTIPSPVHGKYGGTAYPKTSPPMPHNLLGGKLPWSGHEPLWPRIRH